MISYRFGLCHSLEKVFPVGEPDFLSAGHEISILGNEPVTFQIAYFVDCSGVDLLEEDLVVKIKSDDGFETDTYQVGLVPSVFPCNGEHDEDYLTTSPGMFPDLLVPSEKLRLRAVHGQWRALWVEMKPNACLSPGVYPVRVEIETDHDGVIWSSGLSIRMIAAKLPEQKIIHTEMFHADCLADYYKIPVLSEEHWRMIENFMRAAVSHGINMIFTPLFTPPMDTAVGGERTTVQLVKVTVVKNGYEFDFTDLERWIDLAVECGYEYLEMAPLFTQWGAKSAPKVMAFADGAEKQIFGWETDSASEEYTGFLRLLLPKLKELLCQRGILDQTWFHVSDEPREDHIESYGKASRCLKECLPGCHFLDALSSYEFYQKGLVSNPVVSSNHLEPFLNHEVPELWTYYCCVQGVDVSNRFFAMPSCRNRILGVQLYLYHMKGFLHWGYNFYNSRLSVKHINPYVVTDCGESFPSGDAFLVYPGDSGDAVLSIRIKVLAEAFRDIRAFSLLEELTSREYVEKIIQEEAGSAITFKQYPRSASFLLRLRAKVNHEIELKLAPMEKI